jgi:FkbM family methyltransferase
MDNPLHALAAFLLRRRIRGGVRFHAVVCGHAPLAASTKHGIRLRLDPHEYVSAEVLHHGYYEEEVLHAITEDLRPTDVFWDIGACLGIHALTVAKFHPTVRVCAFEPNPAMARLIREAAERNAVPVDVQQLALGARDGSADFYVERDNAGRSGLAIWGHPPEAEKISVSVATADGLVAAGRLPAPTIIKLDAEGGELDILQGMPGLLRSRELRRVIFEDGPGETEMKSRLRAAGFTFRRLTRLREAHPSLENFAATR